jgi:hypothetical protein
MTTLKYQLVSMTLVIDILLGFATIKATGDVPFHVLTCEQFLISSCIDYGNVGIKVQIGR